MIWKFFLVSLSIIALTDAQMIMEDPTAFLFVGYFHKAELICNYLEVFINSSISIRQKLPIEYLGKCMYKNESGHFNNTTIEDIDKNMKDILSVISGNIDGINMQEHILHINEAEKNFFQDIKEFYLDNINNEYPMSLVNIIGIYEDSKYIQNKKYTKLENLRDFVYAVYDADPNLMYYLNEYANKINITVENPKQFVEKILQTTAEKNLDHSNTVQCMQNIENANRTVHGMVRFVDLIEMRGLHATVHAAWIKLLLGNDKYFRALNVKMEEMKKRIFRYYEIQDEISNELQKKQNDCRRRNKNKLVFEHNFQLPSKTANFKKNRNFAYHPNNL